MGFSNGLVNSIYPFREFEDRLLRRKDGARDDPDWAGLMYPPSLLLVEVGGVAASGNYDIQITPDPDARDGAGQPLVVPDVIRYAATVPPDTNADIATGLAAAADVLIASTAAGTLSPYYRDAFVATNAGTTFVGLLERHDAPRYTLSFAQPGGATLSADAGGDLPLSRITSNVRGHDASSRTQLALAFVPVDGSGDPLPDNNGCTFSLEVVREVERFSVYDPSNAIKPTSGVTSDVEVAGWPMTDEYRTPWDGGCFGVRLSNMVNTPTSYAGMEIRYRLVQE